MSLAHTVGLFGSGTRLRVLMYHRIQPYETNGLTVNVSSLEQQLAWLKAEQYQFVSGTQVVAALVSKEPLPPKAVLLTFDDAYADFIDFGFPVLSRFQAPAIVFVPTKFVGRCNAWDGGQHAIMTAEQLQTLASHGIALAYHSHSHMNYRTSHPDDVTADLMQMVQWASAAQLPFLPLFAYPYGAYPKQAQVLKALTTTMAAYGIVGAFRIGNRHNPLPIRKQYQIQRLDIRGDESFERFKRKVRYGKLF